MPRHCADKLGSNSWPEECPPAGNPPALGATPGKESAKAYNTLFYMDIIRRQKEGAKTKDCDL